MAPKKRSGKNYGSNGTDSTDSSSSNGSKKARTNNSGGSASSPAVLKPHMKNYLNPIIIVPEILSRIDVLLERLDKLIVSMKIRLDYSYVGMPKGDKQEFLSIKLEIIKL
ncbi:hypothetical protein Leryth_004761, partial [Lithospermum erythrorhizon]